MEDCYCYSLESMVVVSPSPGNTYPVASHQSVGRDVCIVVRQDILAHSKSECGASVRQCFGSDLVVVRNSFQTKSDFKNI